MLKYGAWLRGLHPFSLVGTVMVEHTRNNVKLYFLCFVKTISICRLRQIVNKHLKRLSSAEL